MPAADRIHAAVKNALIKDGWTITDDPYTIVYKDLRLFADLGADRALAAERGSDRIVVEVKSFVGRSLLEDLERALGQYVLYLSLLELTAPERRLYLAVSREADRALARRRGIDLIVQRNRVAVIVVDVHTEEIVAWKG
jgi:hypothetical protein